jgi:5-methyltetrahydrofolate--homocysteine methyltransferase
MIEFLQRKKVWVFDGAMGTMLQKHGWQIGECPEAYNLSKPEIVFEIHRSYVNAGSDIIQSNTFGANLLRLKMFGLESKTIEINKRGIEIARNAAGTDVIVAASLGPLGELIKPLSETTREQAFDSFREQAKGMTEADFINIETMQSLDEAEIALNAVRSVCNIPISISVTFQKTPRGYFTMMGETTKSFVDRFSNQDVQILGSNCGEGFLQMFEVLSEMKPLTNIPLLAKANAGLPVWKEGEEVYTEEPDFIRDKVNRLFELGVKIVGGCCGTTPEHIHEIKKIANRINLIE